MQLRTDLALELKEECGSVSGVISKERTTNGITVSRIEIMTDAAAEKLGKPKGKYVTVTVPPFTDFGDLNEFAEGQLTEALKEFLPDGTVLVAGLGNEDITPDSIGPRVCDGILATRHIEPELARSIGLDNLRSVCVLQTGVLGKTGIETAEIIKNVCVAVKPAAVVVVDALASRSLSRLGCTVQISDSGIAPGSGVGNKRAKISEQTVGVPVISVGVPTVVDASTLVYDLTDGCCEFAPDRTEEMIVTPKEVDLMCRRAAKFISISLNCALQQSYGREAILELLDI